MKTNGTIKRVITVDPGVRHFGWAFFEGNKLRQAGWKKPGGEQHFLLKNALAMRLLYDAYKPEEVLIEMPKIYDVAHQKGDQTDIRNLAAAAGGMGGAVAGISVTPVYYVEPASWKGQVPKNIFCRRVWECLSPVEQKHVNIIEPQLQRAFSDGDGRGADIVDAIGLGLFRLQRLHKHKIRTSTFSLESIG